MKTALVLFALFVLSGHAFGAESSSDGTFAIQAARDGAKEVDLGQIAAKQGRSDAVKAFGQHMIDDHTRAGEALKAAASRDGVDLSATDAISPGNDRLLSLSGADFDRAYASRMVDDHEKAVALFRREAENGSQANLKAFAQQTLPTLEEHLRMAKALQETITR